MLHVSDVMAMKRDYYQGTKFDLTKVTCLMVSMVMVMSVLWWLVGDDLISVAQLF